MNANRLVKPGEEILIDDSRPQKRFAQKPIPELRRMHMLRYMKNGVCQRVYYQYNRGHWTEGFSVNNLPR